MAGAVWRTWDDSADRDLEAFFDNTPPAAALALRTDEFNAMHAGQDAASFWRARTTAPATAHQPLT